MSFFDEIKDAVGKGGAAINRTGRSAQIRMQLNDLTSRRKDLAAELGSSLYYVTREDESFRLGREVLYNGIAQIDMQMSELRRELEGMTTPQAAPVPMPSAGACPACGQPLVPGAKFCVSCGAAIPEEAPEPVEGAPAPAESPTCPHCGYPRQEGDIFCLNCGTRLS